MSAVTSSMALRRAWSGRVPTWLRQLGWPGLVGAGLLLACAWVIQVELPQRREAVAQAESDVRRLRHGLIAQSNAGSEAASTSRQDAPPQAWARLWSGLPDEKQRLAMQARVLASAAEVGVPLQAVQWQGEAVKWIAPEGMNDRGEASATASKVGAAQPSVNGLWRQRMVMPVQAPYPALRTWLDRLQREPALTVDALDIQRSDVQSDQVQAQVSISLWWRQTKREAP